MPISKQFWIPSMKILCPIQRLWPVVISLNLKFVLSYTTCLPSSCTTWLISENMSQNMDSSKIFLYRFVTLIMQYIHQTSTLPRVNSQSIINTMIKLLYCNFWAHSLYLYFAKVVSLGKKYHFPWLTHPSTPLYSHSAVSKPTRDPANFQNNSHWKLKEKNIISFIHISGNWVIPLSCYSIVLSSVE